MRVTGSDEGVTFWVLQDRMRILLDGQHSGGAATRAAPPPVFP